MDNKKKKQRQIDRVRETKTSYRTDIDRKKFHIAEYPVIVHQSQYGYDVVCPILPGCASQGDTLEEAIENIKSAIQEYLEAVRKVKKNERLVMVEVAV
ncbi:MAG TPA: hypothetical protein DHV62_06935 [Elusimicrobia bacterium]|jgi:predicted RNase H-like HicB family nuclease|nr:hypothetical protein [Elusimicrobiota bacterium]